MDTSDPALTLDCSIRHYHGEHAPHVHEAHAQLLYALSGRMELEVDGHAAFVDTASGLLIPAGSRHGYCAPPGAQILVMDVTLPAQPQWCRLRRFQVPAAARCAPAQLPSPTRLQMLLQSPLVLPRRRLDVAMVERAVRTALHSDWPTARMAALTHLSPQRFHARWLEVMGQTPQQWLRQLRLDAATQLLARGVRLSTSATLCGYASASALAYALRRDRGTSARRLRAST